MKILFSNRDTFHYKGADYGFEDIMIDSFSHLDEIIKEKESEGHTICFIHEVYNQKNGIDVIIPTGPYSSENKIVIRIKFLK